MRVLIIGGGGREHALAWKVARETPQAEIVAAPGNPGIARLGRCVPVAATDLDALLALAERQKEPEDRDLDRGARRPDDAELDELLERLQPRKASGRLERDLRRFNHIYLQRTSPEII